MDDECFFIAMLSCYKGTQRESHLKVIFRRAKKTKFIDRMKLMSETILPFRSQDWSKNPLIAGALAAVEAAQRVRLVRVTTHAASRIHYPDGVRALDGSTFFPTTQAEAVSPAYVRAVRFFEYLQTEDPILS
jgi:hypothetical protein